MEKDKVAKLKKLLRRSEGEDPAEVKREAKEFLESVDTNELIQAEQEIIEEGIAPEALGHLCAAHIEMMSDDLEKMKEKIPSEHPIAVLISEHDEILKFLLELEEVGAEIVKVNAFDQLPIGLFDRMKHLAHHLVAAEKHHQREEEVLFPEIEKRGVYGPPQIMVAEHGSLRELKKSLARLADQQDKTSFAKFKAEFAEISNELVQSLRDHIFKENNILYPAALQVVPESEWRRIGEAADKIGYCCFTPEHVKK